MVNTCMKTAGVVGSSIVAIASLAISVAEYLEVEDDNGSSRFTSSASRSSSTPSSSVPSLSPSSSSSLPTATASPPTRSPSIFETWSPTSSQTPSFPSPPPSSSSPSFSSSSPSFSSSSRSSRGSQMDSDDLYDFSDDDFNAMAFGFLLASVFFLGVSCLFWRSKKNDKSPKIEEGCFEDNEA